MPEGEFDPNSELAQEWANEFKLLPDETLADVLARYERVAARTDALVESLPDLDAVAPAPAGAVVRAGRDPLGAAGVPAHRRRDRPALRARRHHPGDDRRPEDDGLSTTAADGSAPPPPGAARRADDSAPASATSTLRAPPHPSAPSTEEPGPDASGDVAVHTGRPGAGAAPLRSATRPESRTARRAVAPDRGPRRRRPRATAVTDVSRGARATHAPVQWPRRDGGRPVRPAFASADVVRGGQADRSRRVCRACRRRIGDWRRAHRASRPSAVSRPSLLAGVSFRSTATRPARVLAGSGPAPRRRVALVRP